MNHSHVLYDSDPHFKIDPISRNIINESSSKTKLVQHDHNSERFTFELPRYVEGHDMSTCNVVEIHYLNVESNTKIVRAGVYSVTDLQIKADDEDAVVCSWLVGNNATLLVGQLQFLVRFSCVNKDTGAVEYAWNTSIYSSISVSSGIYNSDYALDNPVPAYNLVTTIDGQVLRFFVGTQAEYDKLMNEQKENLFAIITDDPSRDLLYKLKDDVLDLQQRDYCPKAFIGRLDAGAGYHRYVVDAPFVSLADGEEILVKFDGESSQNGFPSIVVGGIERDVTFTRASDVGSADEDKTFWYAGDIVRFSYDARRSSWIVMENVTKNIVYGTANYATLAETAKFAEATGVTVTSFTTTQWSAFNPASHSFTIGNTYQVKMSWNEEDTKYRAQFFFTVDDIPSGGIQMLPATFSPTSGIRLCGYLSNDGGIVRFRAKSFDENNDVVTDITETGDSNTFYHRQIT